MKSKRMITFGLVVLVFIACVIVSIIVLTQIYKNEASKEVPKNEIIIYGDYKCPYCKKVEEKIMPEIKTKYIDTGEAKFKFVNMAFLGKDSIKGSRAGHAVKNIAPNHFLEFQKNIYNKQPNHEVNWITNDLLDKEIDELHISKKRKDKIKRDYKTEKSQAWKNAIKDRKLSREKEIEEAPTVFINNKKVENPYDLKEYKKVLETEN